MPQGYKNLKITSEFLNTEQAVTDFISIEDYQLFLRGTPLSLIHRDSLSLCEGLIACPCWDLHRQAHFSP